MSRVVSSAALQAMMARETDQVFLIGLRISHSSFATIRVVNNTEAVVKTDGTYLPFPFSLNLPDDTEEQVPQVTVSFDNIDDVIVRTIRELNGRPNASFEVFMASTPNNIEAGPFNFAILSTEYDRSTVTCVLGFEEDILNQSVPKGSYLPSNSPGLFV